MLAVAAACGGDGAERATADEADPGSARSAAPAPGRPQSLQEGLLCNRIDDDGALTPTGAEPLQHPGVDAANSESRCMVLVGVNMPIGELRSFFRSALVDLGYEVTDEREGEGIVQGNLSRTFVRASKEARAARVQIDEYDPSHTTLSRHTAVAKIQIDAMGG